MHSSPPLATEPKQFRNRSADLQLGLLPFAISSCRVLKSVNESSTDHFSLSLCLATPRTAFQPLRLAMHSFYMKVACVAWQTSHEGARGASLYVSIFIMLHVLLCFGSRAYHQRVRGIANKPLVGLAPAVLTPLSNRLANKQTQRPTHTKNIAKHGP